MKKFISLLLVFIIAFGASLAVNAVDLRNQVKALRESFVAGEGPVAGDYSVEYMYYSPVEKNDNKKYPLVIWFHGLGDGDRKSVV